MRIGFVSFASSYILSCLFCLVPPFPFFYFSVTRREEEESFGSAVDVDVGNLKWPGAGGKTHSVLEGFDLEPMCTCNPKRLKCLNTRFDHVSIYFLVSEANSPSSTYSIQNISKRVPWENVFSGWLVILPEDWGELLCLLNLIIFNSFLTHSFSIVSENSIMMNRNSTGATLSPCFNPTSKGMDISIFPSISLTLLWWYMFKW